VTATLERELQKCRMWKIRGYGEVRASFSAWGQVDAGRARRWAEVHVRRQHGETLEAMLWRGLRELNRRLIDGMPKPDPAVVARRRLRNATSASRFTN
jgi:hypothetical protein